MVKSNVRLSNVKELVICLTMCIFIVPTKSLAQGAPRCENVFSLAPAQLRQNLETEISKYQHDYMTSYEMNEFFNKELSRLIDQLEHLIAKKFSKNDDVGRLTSEIEMLGRLNESMFSNLKKIQQRLEEQDRASTQVNTKRRFWQRAVKQDLQSPVDIQKLAEEVNSCYGRAQTCHRYVKENIAELIAHVKNIAQFKRILDLQIKELTEISIEYSSHTNEQVSKGIPFAIKLQLDRLQPFSQILDFHLEQLKTEMDVATQSFAQFESLRTALFTLISRGAPEVMVQNLLARNKISSEIKDKKAMNPEQKDKAEEARRVLGQEFAEKLLNAENAYEFLVHVNDFSTNLELKRETALQLLKDKNKIFTLPGKERRIEERLSQLESEFFLSDEFIKVLFSIWPKELTAKEKELVSAHNSGSELEKQVDLDQTFRAVLRFVGVHKLDALERGQLREHITTFWKRDMAADGKLSDYANGLLTNALTRTAIRNREKNYYQHY